MKQSLELQEKEAETADQDEVYADEALEASEEYAYTETEEAYEDNIYDDEIDQALESNVYEESEDQEYADSQSVIDEPTSVIPEISPLLEQTNTGKIYADNVLTEWERMKKDAEEKRLQEVRQRVLQQTGSILKDFEDGATSSLLGGLDIDPAKAVNTLTEDELHEAMIEEQEEQEERTAIKEEVIFEDEEEDDLVTEAEYAEEDNDDCVEELAEIEETLTADTAEITVYMEAISEDEDSEDDEALLFQPSMDKVKLSQTTAETSAEETHEVEEETEGEEYYEAEEETADEEYYEAEEEITDEEYYEAEEETADEEYYEAEGETEGEEYYEAEEEITDEEYYESEEISDEEYYEDEMEANIENEQENSAKEASKEATMDTTEIGDIEQKIIETTKKETKPSKKEVREFTEEEEELFGDFAQTKKVKKQILNALDKISLASYTGNVIITGEPGLGTMDLAKNILKEVQAIDSNFSGKVAKITGEKLNLKNIEQAFAKLNNGALLIEKANGCTEECLYNMSRVLDQEERGIIVIMEDTRHNISQLLKKQAMIADYFNVRIDLVAMNNDALVAYAKNYALEQEYTIDELGILALYTRISDIQAGNHVVTVEEVKDIVDEAIWNSKRFKISNIIDVLFAKRYDEDDMIVLRERDFS